jgi:hypothetical protein
VIKTFNNDKFHPVAFVVTSHETTEDFKNFYEALIDMCKTLKIKYKPVYIMQDACPASKEAILLFFPNVIIFMCYFHVKKNVRDHKKLMPHENFDDLMRFLTKIHYSHNKDEFKKISMLLKKHMKTFFQPCMSIVLVDLTVCGLIGKFITQNQAVLTQILTLRVLIDQ